MFDQAKRTSMLKELFRKSIHICSALVPTLLKLVYWPVIFCLIGAAILYSLCELLRLKGRNIPLVSKITMIAARERDNNKFVFGPVTLVIGILIAALTLPLEYAQVGIYALSFGDGFASLVGRAFGHIEIPYSGGKTIAGSTGCFIASATAAFICSGNIFIGISAGLLTMLIEGLPLGDYDNLVIPIACGSFCSITSGLFGF